MKIRNGFVSNSSSSSFIIFVNDTSIIDELNEKSHWYNDKEAYETDYYVDDYGDKIPIPEYMLSDTTLKAFKVTIEQNNQERNDLLRDPRIVFHQYIGGF